MANGFHGSKMQREKLDLSLCSLDDDLEAFSKRFGVPLSRAGRNGPDRSLEWGDSVRRLIQIYPADVERDTFSFWLCASEDRGSKRYWRREFLKEDVLIGELAANLPELLQRGRQILEDWSSDTLEFATELTPLR